MTGTIIQLPADTHQQTLDLLPWYLTGKLEPAEQAQVEAHLAQCAECQAELRFEQGLRAQLAQEPGTAPSADGWEQLRARVEPKAAGRARRHAWGERLGGAGRLAGLIGGLDAGALRWVAAAQFALILVLVGVALRPAGEPARYHALSAAPAPATGDVVVIFQPDTSERRMRQLLQDNHARIVGGPTAADAYVLYVPPAQRAQALERLRGQDGVELAQPVDGASPP